VLDLFDGELKMSMIEVVSIDALGGNAF
jgi:hypothetical protein